MRAPSSPRPNGATVAGALLVWAWLLAPLAHANVSVIPYRSDHWRYQVYYGAPPSGWQEAGFDDSGFALGCAAFGTQGECYVVPCTPWPLNSRIVLRQRFDRPENTASLIVGAAFDNEIEVYVNGVRVGSGGGTAEQCALYPRATFYAAAGLLQPTGNVIAVLGTDYGAHDLLDVSVEAILSVPEPPPPPSPPSDISSCSATDTRADGVVVSWSDVENEEGYRVYRDGALIGSTGLGETSLVDHPAAGTYSYCIRAYNSVGTSNPCCDYGTRVVVAAPSPCGASDGSSKQVLVSWTLVAGADGYRVYRDGGGIYSAGPSETFYVDRPAPGTYAYCVRAYSAGGESLPCCDPGTLLPLAYPSPCAASDDDPSRVRITWTDVEGEDGYRIYRGGVLIHTTGPDETAYDDWPAYGTYSYCVRAFNALGHSADCCNTGTRPLPPGPTSCQASDGELDGVRFSWTDVAGEDGYRVYRDDVLIHTTGPDETAYLDVADFATHTYCVEAVHGDGSSLRCCDSGWRAALAAPGPCAASDDATSGVTVTWSAVAGAEGYRVYRDDALVSTAAAGATSFVDHPANGTYPYCVEAFNAAGRSPRCCEWGTRPALPAPGPCTASDDGRTGVRLTWTPVTGAEGYRVYRGASLLQAVGPETTEYFDAVAAGTYAYGVEAYSAAGASARCTDSGTRLPLAAPSPCAASDADPDGVTVTWTDVEGETGYQITRDGVAVHLAAPGAVSYRDAPAAGTYTYCVRAVDAFGSYPACCDVGSRPVLPVVGWCRASDADPSRILFEWEDVTGESGYRVYRDDALMATLGPDQTAYADVPEPGDYRYCVEPFFPLGTAARCCDRGRRPSLPAPAACGASDDSPAGVTVTWAAVVGAEGYRVLRDGAPAATLGPEATSCLDTPPAGTYSYCVEAFDARGSSPACCDPGTRPPLAAPGPCDASDADELGVTVTWTAVAGAEGYRVYRDDALVRTAGAGETSWRDVPVPGSYAYCVEAHASWGTSARCCDSGTRAGQTIPFSCAASDTGSVGVLVTWSDVAGESGYQVLRDGALVATVGPDETSYYDLPTAGTYLYCVEAFDALGPMTHCCEPGSRSGGSPGPTNGSARLSWNSCSPQVADQQFVGPRVYKLVVSAIGIGEPVIGHDSNLVFGFGLADAWRFDDGGCQTASQFRASPTAFNKACPAMLGANSLAIVFFGYDAGQQRGALRLAVTYDDMVPTAGVRYTLWQVDFDHAYSVAGPSDPGTTCGKAERGMAIDPEFVEILASSGRALFLPSTPGDAHVTWQGGAPVRTVPVTWGRLKARYR